MALPLMIPNWRSAWRMLSVQANALNVSGLTTWALLPDGLQQRIPTWVVVAFAVGMLVLGIVGRLVAQPALPDSPARKDEARETVP